MFTKDMAYWGKCICCYIFLQKASNILTKFGTAKNLQKNRIHDDNNAQNIIKAKCYCRNICIIKMKDQRIF